MFCLCPREPVGPAGLCAQVLGRSCRCGPLQAARPLISQSAALDLGRAGSANPAALGLGRAQLADPAAFGLGRSGGQGRFGTESYGARSAVLGLWVGQLASVPDAHPPELSGVGSQSAYLRARNQASGERRGCLVRVHCPGAAGGGAPEAVAAAESSLTSP